MELGRASNLCSGAGGVGAGVPLVASPQPSCFCGCLEHTTLVCQRLLFWRLRVSAV